MNRVAENGQRVIILGDLRKYNIYQIATELFRNHHCDADVSVIAAWWVNHNKNPKNWGQLLGSSLSKMSSIVVMPSISKKFVFNILKVYEINKLSNNTLSLLPKIVKESRT